MALVELKNAAKIYGSGVAEVKALHGVTLDFKPGEFTVISGPSGSGKTTMLNLVGCLDVPSEGTVFVDGKNLADLNDRAKARLRAEKIGFIFQSFNLVPVLSAAENVETALHLAGTPGDRRAMAVDMLTKVGLGDLVDRRPNQLSGGQQQRVAVARALVKGPSLVIADEPTANLDSVSGNQILDIMKKMNEEMGVTFLFSTHDPMVMERARRVVTLHDGKLHGDELREGGGQN